MEFNAMIEITNAFSLTDFQRNAKEFLEVLNRDQRPLLLTVNGRVQAVVVDPATFQRLERILRIEDAEKDAELGNE